MSIRSSLIRYRDTASQHSTIICKTPSPDFIKIHFPPYVIDFKGRVLSQSHFGTFHLLVLINPELSLNVKF